MKLVFATILAGLSCMTVRAEDWTVDGKDYHNVKVTQVEADRVHITYDGGVGTVMLSDLTPELQKRFGYDPVAAKAAERQREADQDSADAQLAAEAKQQAAQAAQAAKAPKPPLTFEEKVEATRAAERTELEIEIKQAQGQLESIKVEMAANASDTKQVAALRPYADSAQKEINRLQAELANLK